MGGTSCVDNRVVFLNIFLINASSRFEGQKKKKGAPCDITLDVDGRRSIMMGA